MDLLDTPYLPKDGLEVEDTGDEVLVYLPGGDKTLFLNETAALVWRLCDGHRTGSEMVELLTEAYPDAQAEIAPQVQAALADFIERGLVERNA